MGEYWVYEDMTVHAATAHRADCRYCNHGAGMGAAESSGIAGGSDPTTQCVRPSGPHPS